MPKVEKVEITSPAVSNNLLASTYTCDGTDTSPPLRFAGIPQGTAELLLYFLNLEPVNGQLYIDWAVAGIDPGQHEIQAGKLPAGAVAGLNSAGNTRYSLCPANSQGEHYVAVLIALPRRLPAKTGFDASALRLKALEEAQYEGFLTFEYKHK